jgi:dTDP-4-dehydrorhamnose reductase
MKRQIMKVMILGANGMLGQSLCKVADQRGMQVVRISREAVHDFDIRDTAMLRKFILDERPDVVVNTVAVVDLLRCEQDPGLAYSINCMPVSWIAAFCNQAGAYFIQISTDHYYSGDADLKHDEHAPVKLLNEYAKTKYAAECFTLVHSNALVVRTNIVGFRNKPGKPTFLEWLSESIASKETITLFDDFYTSSIHTYQFARCLYDLIEKTPTGVINIACRDVVSKRDFAVRYAQKLGIELDNFTIGSVKQMPGVQRAESLGLDCTKAEHLLGYAMPTIDEVIDSIILEKRGKA